ncbi:MAG: hypothetical protein WBX15_10750 [Thermoanaerobaculia bacterium]
MTETDADGLTNGESGKSQDPSKRIGAILLAELPGYDQMLAVDPVAAPMLANLMQQMIGEIVYLFDGHVIDPFGPRLLAELPTAAAAVKAAMKVRSDLLDHNLKHLADGNVIEPRLVVHYGEVLQSGLNLKGRAVATALLALEQASPLQLLVSEGALSEAGTTAELQPVGTFDGVVFREKWRPDPSDRPKPEPEEAVDERVELVEAPIRRTGTVIGIASVALVVIALVVGFLVQQRMQHRRELAAAEAAAARARAEGTQQRAALPLVFVQPATVPDGENFASRELALSRAALQRILITDSQLKLGTVADGASLVVGSEVRLAADGKPEVVPFVVTNGARHEGTPVASAKSDQILAAMLSTISKYSTLAAGVPAADEGVLSRYLTLVAALQSDDPHGAAAATAAKSATKDESFLPSQLAAFDFFAEEGKVDDALDAGRNALRIQPENRGMIRRVAALAAESGHDVESLQRWEQLLRLDPHDPEALRAAGLYALSAGDSVAFEKIRSRLKVGTEREPFHEPDMQVVFGRIDQAANPYFDAEVGQPKNAALALKIGRVAVLRRSTPIAELELKKLQTLDPDYGYHILNAFMAAERGNAAVADAELEAARPNAKWGDAFYTASAEVYTLLNRPEKTIETLETAVRSGEPTYTYIINHPLFRFLKTEQRFQKLISELRERAAALQSALAPLRS